MASVFLKWLVLAALVFMSFGMAPASAAAQPAAAHHAVADTGHCDERSDHDPAPDARADCMAMCVTLAAADGPGVSPVTKLEVLRNASLVAPFTGVLLDIATPPPRFV